MSAEITRDETGALTLRASGRDADGLLDMLPRVFEWSRDEATKLSMNATYEAAHVEVRSPEWREHYADAERARRVALAAEALLRAAKREGLL